MMIKREDIRMLPAVLADQRHECDRAEILPGPAIFIAYYAHERLMFLIRPHGNDKPTADGKLMHKRIRHFRPAGGDENRLKWAICVPPISAVPRFESDVTNAELRE